MDLQKPQKEEFREQLWKRAQLQWSPGLQLCSELLAERWAWEGAQRHRLLATAAFLASDGMVQEMLSSAKTPALMVALPDEEPHQCKLWAVDEQLELTVG